MLKRLESFEGVFFGAIVCFAIAFVLSAVLPVMALDKIQPEFRTIKQLAENVSEEFKLMAKNHPETFKEAFPAGVNQETYAEALRLGRDVYVAEACWHCHSQYIRPVAVGKADVFQHDGARFLQGDLAVRDGLVVVQQAEDLLQGADCALDHGQLLTELADGLEELADVVDEGGQQPRG